MLGASPLDEARQWRAVILGCRSAESESVLLKVIQDSSFLSADFSLDSYAFTPLIGACIANNPWLISRLVALGVSADRPDDGGWTPLHWCCQYNFSACVLALLVSGANPNLVCPGESLTCLHFCAQRSAIQCARLLLAYGADADAVDPVSGASPRHWAAHDLELSLSMSSTAPGFDQFSRTSVHWAISQAEGDAQALHACLRWVKLGVDPMARDKFGCAPIDLARSRDLKDCSAYLHSLGELLDLQGMMPGPQGVSFSASERLTRSL